MTARAVTSAGSEVALQDMPIHANTLAAWRKKVADLDTAIAAMRDPAP